MKSNVDFATFCHAGDAHRLHAPGQLKRQVESNGYQFNKTIIVYQEMYSGNCTFNSLPECCEAVVRVDTGNIDFKLKQFGISQDKLQYQSPDKAHGWKNHIVNHLTALNFTKADYIVFADNDCWMVKQPKSFGGFELDGKTTVFKDGQTLSWVDKGIELMKLDPLIFISSPNDGEPERKTKRFSQQMFLARVDEFRNADFNQPFWDGNVNIPGGPMPEYWAMLEGRMELHCRVTGQYRYVLDPEYRYYHHNKLTKDDLFETDISKY